jgi:hypothetical protein
VSRLLSRMHDDGLIKVNLRQVELIDVDALRAIANGPEPKTTAESWPLQAAA